MMFPLLAVLAVGVSLQDEPQVLAEYEPAACPFDTTDWGAEVGLACGVLEVPEDRGNPKTRTLRLPVAIFPAAEPVGIPPLVVLHGGPGLGTEFLPAYARGVAQTGISRVRDVVLYNQRGAGYAEPALCPGFIPDGPRNRSDSVDFRTLAARCMELLRAEGVDPEAYTTHESALDLRALREALGYEVWDVYAESYGGRLAVRAMGVDPSGIRSVVLERPTPDGPWRTEVAASRARAMSEIFAACAADAACEESFPDPEADLVAVYQRYEAEPASVPGTEDGEGRLVDGAVIMEAFADFARRPNRLVRIPFLLDQLRRGDRDRALEELVRGWFDSGSQPRSVAFWLIECNDGYQPGFEALQDSVERSVPAMFAIRRRLECDIWTQSEPGAAIPERTPEAPGEPGAAANANGSDIPVLILTGQFDPITPPEYGDRIARALPNARVYEMPWESHDTREMSPCHRAILQAFMMDPHGNVDDTCTSSMEPPSFVTAWPAEDGGP
jgi:pimeloyl-ACP methyl ester carboxylesterase